MSAELCPAIGPRVPTTEVNPAENTNFCGNTQAGCAVLEIHDLLNTLVSISSKQNSCRMARTKTVIYRFWKREQTIINKICSCLVKRIRLRKYPEIIYWSSWNVLQETMYARKQNNRTNWPRKMYIIDGPTQQQSVNCRIYTQWSFCTSTNCCALKSLTDLQLHAFTTTFVLSKQELLNKILFDICQICFHLTSRLDELSNTKMSISFWSVIWRPWNLHQTPRLMSLLRCFRFFSAKWTGFATYWNIQ